MRPAPACLALLLLAACRPAPEAAPEPSGAGPATAPAAPDVVESRFRCGDLLAGARFDNARSELVLTVATRRIVLPQALSASGARYSDAAGNEFWNKGNEATLVLDGQRHACASTDELSPWDEARGRGAVFRGLGTEPFWSLEVAGGDAPDIQLALDMGERPLRVAGATRLPGREGFRGIANDGSEVELRIVESACSDGMSDMDYPATVELKVGPDTLRGCGAFLDQ